MNAQHDSHLIFDKDAKNAQWRKDSVFNKRYWENWISTCGRMTLDTCLSPCTKINSKWTEDMTLKPKRLKFLEENIYSTYKTDVQEYVLLLRYHLLRI